MTLRLYDTRTRTVGELQLQRPGHVGVYVCGPTVQAAPHVGHLRSAVAVDVLHRWLLATGHRVTFVRNVTDVDDKIIHDAGHHDEPYWALATRMTNAFTRAYDAVQVLPPTVEPRVTGHLPQIVALIEHLIDNGTAYESGGDVYLSVQAVPSYGEISHQDPTKLKQGEADDSLKRDPLDFALWKAAKPGEPRWSSPWGPGRPGWHIECSAMAVEYLGTSFDIHAGGLDLVFPHHENENAQSTAAGHGFATTWVHHGLVTAKGGEKMSKSLGNSVLVTEALSTVPAPVLRYALGAAHYRSTIEWSDQVVGDAAAAYDRIATFVRNATELTVGVAPVQQPGWEDFAAALDDDLGVPQALAAVHNAVRRGNIQLADRELPGLSGTLALVRRMLGVLCLDPISDWPSSGSSELTPVVDALVRLLVETRAQARERKDWAQADALRDRLTEAGIVLEDTADGVRWRLT
ncbi:MAG: cysteinyl-tRNA synthetase [Frankiales bacterium]|nr:cysteinyl-tRNA synthetase [Frankiales bacterium]